MLATTESVALVGTDAHIVQVEVDIGQGLPSFTVVGLPTRSVREAEQRTKSALGSADESWPKARVVASLAPGGLRKDGTHFDLPLAIGLLAAGGRLESAPLEGWVLIGELALDGSVRPVRGTLAAAIAARRAGRRGLICPAGNAREARLVDDIEVVPVARLTQCLEFLRGDWRPEAVPEPMALDGGPQPDLSEVRGHPAAKRALEIAAAGGHNLLMVGPPGSGKTMLAQRLPGILPSMSIEESLEVTRVFSVAGLLSEDASLVSARPFRVPHHHVSLAGLVGGGAGLARPGEASLAHHGVLFLDELSLYRKDVLETLRAPLEEGVIRIARSGGVITFPCRFSLIAAMNPCPCGYLGDSRRACRCSAWQLEGYRSKLSGPLLDRFDMQVTMARLGRKELLGEPDGESSYEIRKRVESARALQAERYSSTTVTNASATKAQLESAIELSASARHTLGSAIDSLALSGRGLDRVLRVGRTLADLEQRGGVIDDDIAEALAHRALGGDSGVAA